LGLKEEAKTASKATLNGSLGSLQARNELKKIGVEAAIDLIAFHDDRKNAIMKWMTTFLSPEGVAHRCATHQSGLQFSPSWKAFQMTVLEELDKKPSGETLHDLSFIPSRLQNDLWQTYMFCEVDACNRYRHGGQLTMAILRRPWQAALKSLTSEIA
jgi:hypothetical protein